MRPSEIVAVESRARTTMTLLRVLVLGFAVIFIGGELADALVAELPAHADLIKTSVAAVVGVVVVVIAMPLFRRRGGGRGSASKADPPT
jgi:uncharacterized membrane protein YeiH